MQSQVTVNYNVNSELAFYSSSLFIAIVISMIRVIAETD